MRVCLLYSGILIGFASTVYFGSNLSLVRVVVLALLTSIVCTFVNFIFTKCFCSKKGIIRFIGFVLFLGVNGILVYIIMAVAATTNSFSQINDWSIQFGISLLSDKFFF
jgi:phage shock protein PspC (stress-responsive transcriptional regulator)